MQNNNFNLCLLVLINVLFNFACSSIMSNTSWGRMIEYQEVTLLKVPPKGKVTVCADNKSVGQHIAKAILVWAKEIQRDKYMTSDDNCSSSADIKLSARLTDPSICPTAQTYPTLGQIEYNSSYMSFPVMLHEVGHNWGLCDQYDGVANCDDTLVSHTNNDKVKESVMASNNSSVLMKDDIDGIRAIASFSGIGQNDAWKEFLVNVSDSTDNSSTDDSSSTTQEEINPWIEIYSGLFDHLGGR